MRAEKNLFSMTTATRATATPGVIGVIDDKSPPRWPIKKINHCAVQVKGKLLARNQRNAVRFKAGVQFRVVFRIKSQGVLQTRAATTANGHA